MENTIPSPDEASAVAVATESALDPVVSTAAINAAKAVQSYTRQELMSARHMILSVKRTARQGGFGQVAGRIIRDTIGYKFDNMSVDAVLATMDTPDFLKNYKAKLVQWHDGLNKSASADTLKKNAAAFKSADALTADPHSFSLLVKSLRVLCVRNQDWREDGNNLSLPMNGHRAMLDLFCINVTNARRLALATA